MRKIFTIILILCTFTSFSQVRISQVYGGGGNTGATYNQDFVEIFNSGSSSVDISAWSIQYASATGPNVSPFNWAVAAIPASTTLGAGKYFLIALGTGVNGVALPTPDLTVTAINMSGSAGKVALVNILTALSGTTACSGATVVDVIGFGATATCFEGAAFLTSGITTAQSITRKTAGCTDAGDNSTDLAIAAVSPRNSGTAANLCAGGPVLNAGPGVTGLATSAGVASTALSFNVSGGSLTGFPGNIVVSSTSTDFQVSLSSGSGFASSVNIPFTSATLASVTVFVRISASAALGAVASTVKVNGGTASEGIVNVSGNVLAASPATQASNVAISNLADNSLTVNWTNGNGSSRIVVIRQTATSQVNPTDGAVYTANTSISTAGTTGSGNFVVFTDVGGSPVNITGLIAGTNYTVTVYEFNGSTGSNNYLVPGATAIASTTGVSPNLTQVNFTGISVPQFTGSGTSSRTPTMFIARLSNLTPNTTYRYYTQAAISTDLGTTSLGGGSGLMVDYTASPITYTYASTVSLSAANGYSRFTTDASGNFTGSFGFVNSGNARFTAGNIVIPTIALSVDPSSTTLYRFALDQTITVLGFAITSTAFDGTFIKGTSSASPGNLVGLWDNTTAIGRPLSMTISENPTIAGAPWAISFVTGYDQTAGSWNTIIPNVNANGIRLIQQFNIINGAVLGCNSDANGTWPTGVVVTSNPTGGAVTPLQLSNTDAPLNTGACFGVVSVKFEYLNAKKINTGNTLNWKVTCQSASIVMEIERAGDSRSFKSLFRLSATQARCSEAFDFLDAQPLKGNNFYRLKMINIDGKISYSPIVLIINKSKGMELVGLYPSIVKTHTSLSVSSAMATFLHSSITDKAGRSIKTYKHSIPAGSSLISIDCSNLATGIYNLTVIADDGTLKTIRFVKN